MPTAHYHITYRDRQGHTQTGRVSVAANLYEPATKQRGRAMQAAAFKYDCAQKHMSAVRVRPPAAKQR